MVSVCTLWTGDVSSLSPKERESSSWFVLWKASSMMVRPWKCGLLPSENLPFAILPRTRGSSPLMFLAAQEEEL